MTVVVKGEREVIQRFDTFPQFARTKLEQKIRSLMETLESRVQAAAPRLTGQLRSEIGNKVYADNPNRIAGYVGVYARESREYAKAATLEYGSDAVRRRFAAANNRLIERATRPVHIEEFRYLRSPFEQMIPEIEAGLAQALQEAVDQS